MNCFSLELEKYRDLVQLDEDFEKQRPIPENIKEREIIVDLLLDILRSEILVEEKSINVNLNPISYEEKRRLLYIFLTIRSPKTLPDWFHIKLDSLFQREFLERNITDSKVLPKISQIFKEIYGIFYGNIQTGNSRTSIQFSFLYLWNNFGNICLFSDNDLEWMGGSDIKFISSKSSNCHCGYSLEPS